MNSKPDEDTQTTILHKSQFNSKADFLPNELSLAIAQTQGDKNLLLFNFGQTQPIR